MTGDDMNLVWLLLAAGLLLYLQSWLTTVLAYGVARDLGWARGEIAILWFYRRLYGVLPDLPAWWRSRGPGSGGGWPGDGPKCS